MNMSSKLLCGSLLAGFLLLAGCSQSKAPVSDQVAFEKAQEQASEGESAALKPLDKRQSAPRFELKDANGAKVTIEEYKGKVVLLNFWATWCVPCKAEIPWFQEFDKKYKDQGFAVLGVSLDEEGWGAVKPYVDERKISYRMVVGTEEVSQLYGGIDSLPTTFMIDKDGKIAAIHTGLVSKATYQKQLESLLTEGAHARSGSDAREYAFFRAR
jgi:cytochrome c biogenesis protein CcmG/thiol:disulfide interchange protein DsbE